MKKFIGLGVAAVSLLASSSVAFAQGAPQQTAVTSIGGDRYVAGSDVSVNQPVGGDLLIGGRTVTVNVPVSGSVQAMGGTVILNNTVDGNVRIFGGTVIIMKNIRGNVLIGGGTVRIQPGVTIGGSVMLLSGEATIDGNINGNLKSRGGSVILHGIVRGDVDLQGDSIEQSGQVQGNAVIAGRTITTTAATSFAKNLTYWQAGGQRDFTKVVKGTVKYDPTFAIKEKPNHKGGVGVLAGIITAITIYSILSGALMIGLFLFLSKTFFKDAAKVLKTKPGMSFLTGLLYFLITPIATVLLLITVIGLPIAIAVALLFALSILFAKALSAMVFARYLETQYKKKWNNWMLFVISLGIFLGLKLIAVIPVVGWIVTTVAVLVGYGAVLRVKYERFKKVM